MIRLSNLHKKYAMGSNELHVLKGIDLTIDSGDLFSIMGPSGSGKSTLLNIIGLLDTQDSVEYQLLKLKRHLSILKKEPSSWACRMESISR